jgi:CheY-like chemotaxis protein
MSIIMVVDDEDDTRYVVRHVLEKEGHVVVEAGDGRECLEKIREDIPDLVLLDIMMPGLDGWDVLAAIQRDLNLKSVPVTMFTVKPLTPETVRRKEALGLVNYIVKPFSSDGLITSISKTLGSLSRTRKNKERLELLDSKKAEKYDGLSRQLILHKNFLSVFESVLKQRKEDGSMDDIQSFEDVIRSESVLIGSYLKSKEEIEKLVKGKGLTLS